MFLYYMASVDSLVMKFFFRTIVQQSRICPLEKKCNMVLEGKYSSKILHLKSVQGVNSVCQMGNSQHIWRNVSLMKLFFFVLLCFYFYFLFHECLYAILIPAAGKREPIAKRFEGCLSQEKTRTCSFPPFCPLLKR